ncbi:MAG: DUF72 domain-containing protein [Gammaproteobacteria bacterium]|nr:MAG: DUF72 domain-containing protein [Gammaproteobacteria bacterium]
MLRAGIRVGTSGWAYPHWRGVFYPPELPSGRWLAWYQERLDTVELNNSFYRLPERETFAAWGREAPEGFLFAVKANRYITHLRKLREPRAPLERLLGRAAALGPHLGPVLFQLPPRWRCDLARLEAFLEALGEVAGRLFPGGLDCAMEFRDPDWWREEVYGLLERHGVAWCIFDLAGTLSPLLATAPLVYVRLHGPDGPYAGSYDGRALAAWARRILAWRAAGRRVCCYFDNDQAGYAVRNALALRRRLAEALQGEAGRAGGG